MHHEKDYTNSLTTVSSASSKKSSVVPRESSNNDRNESMNHKLSNLSKNKMLSPVNSMIRTTKTMNDSMQSEKKPATLSKPVNYRQPNTRIRSSPNEHLHHTSSIVLSVNIKYDTIKKIPTVDFYKTIKNNEDEHIYLKPCDISQCNKPPSTVPHNVTSSERSNKPPARLSRPLISNQNDDRYPKSSSTRHDHSMSYSDSLKINARKALSNGETKFASSKSFNNAQNNPISSVTLRISTNKLFIPSPNLYPNDNTIPQFPTSANENLYYPDTQRPSSVLATTSDVNKNQVHDSQSILEENMTSLVTSTNLNNTKNAQQKSETSSDSTKLDSNENIPAEPLLVSLCKTMPHTSVFYELEDTLFNHKRIDPQSIMYPKMATTMPNITTNEIEILKSYLN